MLHTKEMILLAALHISAALVQAPAIIWTQSVPSSYAIRVVGNDILLKHRNSEWSVHDAATGTRLGMLDNVDQARLSAGRLLVVRGTWNRPEAIEAWTLRPFVREWQHPVDARYVGIGEMAGDSLYYGEDGALLRVSLPDFAVEDRRDLWPAGAPRPVVNNGHVYFHTGNEVFRLAANNLARGWRSYCNTNPQHIDELGAVGTTTVGFSLTMLGLDGKPYWPKGPEGWYFTINRVPPAVTQEMVVAGGSAYTFDRGITSVMSPYLMAFNRSDGMLKWKVPLLTTESLAMFEADIGPVIVRDKVVLYGANRVNGEPVWTLQVRALSTGELLWKSAPVALGKNGLFAANGDLVIDYNEGTLRAWRIPQ